MKVMANDGEAKTTPVYVPYATLISSFDALKLNGIPHSGILDKSIWDTQSGAIQGQLIMAYKFLGLITDQRAVVQGLNSLVHATPEDRKPILKKIIEDKYRSAVV